jgi:hypothetical protein
MTVITETTTLGIDAEAMRTPATPDTARPVEVHSELAWLLAQAYVSTPLFA